MPQIVNLDASPNFAACIGHYWQETPLPLARLYQERGWTVVLERLPPPGYKLAEAETRPQTRTIAYYERRLAGLFGTARSNCSEISHYHELGHFYDLTQPDGWPLSDRPDFTAALTLDSGMLTLPQRDRFIQFLHAPWDYPERARRECFAEIFADNLLHITDGLAAVLPTVSRIVGAYTQPLVLGK